MPNDGGWRLVLAYFVAAACMLLAGVIGWIGEHWGGEAASYLHFAAFMAALLGITLAIRLVLGLGP